MASSWLFRSAGRALRRSIPRRSYSALHGQEGSSLFFSTTDWAGRRQSGYKRAFPLFARSLAENPRRLFSSDCGGRTEPNEKLFSMDEVLEHKRQFEKNKEEEKTFRDAEISEHESQEEKFHRRLSSTVEKLSHSLNEQRHLMREIKVQVQNSDKYDQVKYFLVFIPSFVCIGLILDKVHMFG